MPVTQTLRHVPWTCRWGQFGGPVNMGVGLTPGFVFWMCNRPGERLGPKPLGPGNCERCEHWEAIEWPHDHAR